MGSMLAFLIFTSCKKEIDQPLTKQSSSPALSTTASACKPAIFGTYETYTGAWTTIAQKWYNGNKIQFIKVHFTGRPENISQLNHTEPVLNIDWGQVTYEGDQVRVWDVAQNRMVFRATLDEFGRPVATYLYNKMGTLGSESMYIDTSYYYYTSDRLNYIIQLFERRFNGSSVSKGWEQYNFNYNSSGNVTSYFSRNDKVSTDFTYGATNNGALLDYILTTPYKMLEYLELTKFPTNATLTRIQMTRLDGIHLPFTFFDKSFFNYAITNGLVQSYLNPYGGGQLNYYIGWDCGGNSAISSANKQGSVVSSLQQFKDLYPTTAQ